MSPLLVVAGEASGDRHGAALLTELRQLRPGLEAFGIGGDRLASQGVDLLAHARDMGLVGLFEVLRHLRRLRRVFDRVLAECDRRRPAVALLIDYPDFNLRLARELVRRGVRVAYYVSPQLWAWRPGRVKQVRERVERMLVVFPFEVEFYRRRGVEAHFVGHPLLDEAPPLADWSPVPGRRRIALLPGSRHAEVRSLLPAMLDGARRLAGPGVSFELLRAPTITAAELAAAGLRRSTRPADLEVVATENPMERLADCDVALVASGTATLETAIAGTPMVVCYRLNPLTYHLANVLVKLPDFALVNIVAGRRAVPELLQGEVTGSRLAAEARAILDTPGRAAAMRAELAEVREKLGGPGASRRAAVHVAELLG